MRTSLCWVYINTIVFAHRTHADILIINSCVSRIPIAAPDVLIHQARVKVTHSKQSHTNDKESFVRKVCLWWGEPFEKPAIYSLARDLKILVSVVRFRPRPPDLHRSFARYYGVSFCVAGGFRTANTSVRDVPW